MQDRQSCEGAGEAWRRSESGASRRTGQATAGAADGAGGKGLLCRGGGGQACWTGQLRQGGQARAWGGKLGRQSAGADGRRNLTAADPKIKDFRPEN